MSQQEVRGIQEKMLKRVDSAYEGWVNGRLLFKLELSLENSLEVGRMIAEGVPYIDARPQTIAELTGAA